MFVQTIRNKRGTKKYETHLIRESYRTEKGPRHRTIANITGLPEDVRDMIASALKSGCSMVNSNALGLSEALDFGGLAVLHEIWDRFNLDQVLGDISDLQVKARLKAMVFGRILFPVSKLALQTVSHGTALAKSCGLEHEDLDEDLLYAAMDFLNGNWVKIEKGLYREGMPDGVTLVLYDLTSTYFEGKSPINMGKYGYSRDGRSDRKQVILAVATDSSGIPIHMEVLKVNRTDNSTLRPLLENLKRRFGLKKAVFVFDGGMSSSLNLEQMTKEEMDYVIRLSSSTLQALIKDLPHENQPELWDRDQLIEFEVNGTRYVVAGSEFRRHRDQKRRTARIAKGIDALTKIAAVNRKKVNIQKLSSQVGSKLLTLKSHKYFEYHINSNGKLEWNLKSNVLEQESRLDGWYVLSTSISTQIAPKEDIFKCYRSLLEVESAFRQIKTYLKMRPVFHYCPDRVRNHIRICFLSYWISARLGIEWLARGEHREVPLILSELQQIRIGKLRLGKKPVKTLITDIPKKLKKLLEKLDLFHIFDTVPKWIL